MADKNKSPVAVRASVILKMGLNTSENSEFHPHLQGAIATTPAHRSAARTLGFALTLGNTADHWFSLAKVWLARLKRAERSNILVVAIAAAGPDDAAAIMADALNFLTAGEPVAVFTSYRTEACNWADFATLAEKRAYLSAIFTRLPTAEQRSFTEAASRKVAA